MTVEEYFFISLLILFLIVSYSKSLREYDGVIFPTFVGMPRDQLLAEFSVFKPKLAVQVGLKLQNS